jgi:hypothetical protein
MTAGTQQAGATARRLVDRRSFRVLARCGFAAVGVVHVLIGYLAVRVATNSGGGESDQSGALRELARLPGGIVVLWLTVVGLFALCVWLVVGAIVGAGTAKRRWVRSLSSAAQAVGYGALGVTATKVALGAGASSAKSSRTASAALLSTPAGPWLLGAVGLAIVGVGVYFAVKGIRRGFTKDLDVTNTTPRKGVVMLGVVGYVAKGVAIAVMGVLFVVAATSHDAQRASGLDGALTALASLPAGTVVLLAVGVGLACYGVYSFARARYARL